jgi:predicted tellurium resistance membrane protein TerC
LGIDNIIFISILASRLPANQQQKARRIGLLLAAVMRLILLSLVTVIMQLQNDLFILFGAGISPKDIILILGGLFLLYKSAKEIYHKLEGSNQITGNIKTVSFTGTIGQILIMDLIFSVDSIITAVGLVSQVWVMYVAVILTVGIMLVASGPVSDFINRHPAFKVLALSFLLLIGFALLAEGFDVKIPKGYIYFSMAFALFVDIIQMKMQKKKSKSVKLHDE